MAATAGYDDELGHHQQHRHYYNRFFHARRAAHHFLFNLAIVAVLLWIESRRYRFYDAFRARVRMLEAHFLVPMVMENRELLQGEWKKLVCEDLILPCFKITKLEAIGRRMKRNYMFIFILILIAWLTKIFLHASEPINDVVSFYRALRIGHIPSFLWRWFSWARLSLSFPSPFTSANVPPAKSPSSARTARSGAFKACGRDQQSCYNEFMRTLTSYLSRFLLILIFFSAVSVANAAAKSGGRLIVIRVANFGWNLAANLKIDGQTVANIVQGRRYDHRIPAGRHVLTVSAVPNNDMRQPTSITVNVRPGGTYIFTALWDSDHVYLRPTTLSPAEMAKLGL